MIQLVRIYCWRNGVQWIEDYALPKASKERLRLVREGVTVYHTEVV